jgi:hypothetical protein
MQFAIFNLCNLQLSNLQLEQFAIEQFATLCNRSNRGNRVH